MQVQKIQSTNFQSKKKFLPQDLSISMRLLKNNMRKETIVIKSNDIERTINVRSLNINGGEAVFKDGRFLATRDKNNNLVPCGSNTSMLEIGKVRILSKDNGEVIDRRKPFFKRWKSVLKDAKHYIETALINYDDINIVQKQLNKNDTLTKSGKINAEKVMKLFDSLNPFK